MYKWNEQFLAFHSTLNHTSHDTFNSLRVLSPPIHRELIYLPRLNHIECYDTSTSTEYELLQRDSSILNYLFYL